VRRAVATVAGSSISMGSDRLPQVLVAPADPLLVRREDLRQPQTAERLVAEARQAFADAGSVRA
jgi:hypothetical protein